MIEHKDIPQEYVSIRQVWLMQINRCTEAISHRFMMDGKDVSEHRAGLGTVMESVIALRLTLIDFGDATILSDVNSWRKIHKQESDLDLNYWRSLFHFIIQTLNKYGMLFDTNPKGYSNVTMRSLNDNSEK